MAEVDFELPQEPTLRTSAEQAGIGNLMSHLELQAEACPGALALHAA